MHGLARARRLGGVAVLVVLVLSVVLGAGSGPAAAEVSSYDVGCAARGADDPLDRTTDETVTKGGTTRTTRFTYLGASEQVAAEEQRDGSGAWKVTKAYTYGPDQRPVMLTATPINGQRKVRLYSTNPRGDVEALTDPEGGGSVTASYRYHAYGSPDAEGTLGEDEETAEPGSIAEPVNPYRYNAKRADTAMGGIDMGFRNYDPGINQFTSRDSYNGALADLQLGSDPWNTNRYAFTGGNPITRVEMDGHMAAPVDSQIYGEKKVESLKADYEHCGSSCVGSGDGEEAEAAAQDARNSQVYIAGQGNVDRQYAENFDPCAQTTACNSREGSTLARLFLFDERACDGESRLACTAQVALALPTPAKIFKVLKLAKYVDEAEEGVQGAANTTTSLVGKKYGLGKVVENPGLTIQGFRGAKNPSHGLNQIINRGVSPSMLRDTVANPRVVLEQGSGNFVHIADDAAVVLRPDGQLVTTYGRSDFKQHIFDILGDVG